MAKKNKLEKYGVVEALVHYNYDASSENDTTPSIVIRNNESHLGFRIQYQRTRVVASSYTYSGSEISTFRTMGHMIRPSDVGAYAYGTSYGGRIVDVPAIYRYVEPIVKILKAMSEWDTGSMLPVHDELLDAALKLEQMGVPVRYRYHGQWGSMDNLLDVPKQYKGKFREWLLSEEAGRLVVKSEEERMARAKEKEESNEVV
jgi:hypothetical protein